MGGKQLDFALKKVILRFYCYLYSFSILLLNLMIGSISLSYGSITCLISLALLQYYFRGDSFVFLIFVFLGGDSNTISDIC